MYYLPLYFQSVIGASPLLSGVYILPVTLMAHFCSTFTGGYIKKTGRYQPLLYFGTALMLLGHGLYINLKPYASWSCITIYQLILAIDIGPLFQAPIISASAKPSLLMSRVLLLSAFLREQWARQYLLSFICCHWRRHLSKSHGCALQPIQISAAVGEG